MRKASGSWNFHVGIPAAASSSGGIIAVIPNVMGLAIYSPRINNQTGVSSRGMTFATKIAAKFKMSIFSQLVYGEDDFVIPTPPKNETKRKIQNLYDLCYFAALGDLNGVRRLINKGANVLDSDYDKRTPLHLACTEGHLDVALELISHGALVSVKDRWGNSPLNDAESHGHVHMNTHLMKRYQEEVALKLNPDL